MDSKTSSIAIGAGGLMLAVGSFLDWGTVFDIGVSGMDGGDGWFTLIAGGVIAAIGFMLYSGKSFPSWITWVALAVGAAVTLINFFDILGEELVDLGVGMYLMVAGIIVVLLGLLAGRKSSV